jgi:cyanophycin synthetase
MHAEVMTELENWTPQAQPGAGTTSDSPVADPDYQPTTVGSDA